MVKKYFGTDGIRGTVGVFPITADFMLKIGWAAGTVFKQHSKGKKKRVLILVFAALFLSCASEKIVEIEVTSSSPEALRFFNKAMKYFQIGENFEKRTFSENDNSFYNFGDLSYVFYCVYGAYPCGSVAGTAGYMCYKNITKHQ